MLTLQGRPILHYIMDALAEAGVQSVCLVTNYLSEQIHQYVGDGSRWGVAASFRHQEQLNGVTRVDL